MENGFPSMVEIRTTANMGRGVFATADISAGTTIFSTLPLVHCSNQEQRGLLCEHCLSPSQSLKKCSRCKLVHYCNRCCQQKDWSMHKIECEGVAKAGCDIVRPTTLMRLALRALTKYQQLEQLCSLPVDHFSTGSGDKEKEELFMAAMTRLTEQPAHILHELLRKLVCNTFSIFSDDLTPLGVGLFTSGSLFNHSCRPNAVAVFNGPRLLVRTVETVSSGKQLFISYTETLELSTKRQTQLRNMYNFTCDCVRCEEDTSNSPDSSDHLLLLEVSGRECSWSLRQYLGHELQVLDELQKRGDIQTIVISHKAVQALAIQAEALYQKYSHKLGLYNIFTIKVTDHLFQASLHHEHWSDALTHSNKLLEPSLQYYGSQHPVSVVQLLRTGKLRRCVGTSEQLVLSIQDLTKARDAALIVFGREHSVTIQAQEMLRDSQLELALTQVTLK